MPNTIPQELYSLESINNAFATKARLRLSLKGERRLLQQLMLPQLQHAEVLNEWRLLRLAFKMGHMKKLHDSADD